MRPHEIVLGFEETRGAGDHADARAGGIDEREWAGSHIRRLAAKDLRCRGERLSADQPPDDKGISGCRHFAWLPFARDEQRVEALPRDGLLSLRQRKAARYEPACDNIELTDCRRVFAPVREREQTETLLGPLAVGAMPDPVRFFARRKRIKVQHCCPCRRRGAIAGERCLAPDPAYVRRILPEVVERAANKRDIRNAVLRLCHRER